MKKALCVVLAWTTLLALSPAPIKDMINGKLEAEKSESARSLEQTGARQNEVGGVSAVEEAPIAPSLDVQNAGAENVGRATAATNGERAIKKASEDLEKAKPQGFPWITAIFVFIAGFGVFQAFKMWANKNLPEPGKFK